MKAYSKKITVSFLLYTIIFLNSIMPTKAEEINGKSAILIDVTTDTIMFEKNSQQKNFPASTTKIMTALLTLEHCKNFEDKIKMSHDAVYSIAPGSSHIAMNEGETLTVEQALYGLLVASANEIANALAEYVSGNVNDFCKLMNERAKKLGCKNTNFVNPHGYHNDEHFSCAYDIALMMKEAIKYEEFNKIINTKRYEIAPTEKQTETRILYNTNKMIQYGEYYDADVVGGKTGYTNEANHTLAIYAKRDDMQLISVVMGEENFDAYTDTKKILNDGFNKFHDVELIKKNDWQKNCTVTQKYKNKILDIDTVNVYPESDVVLKLPNTIDKNELKITNELAEKISAPAKKTLPVGKIFVTYKNKIINETKLFPEENINLLDEKIIAKINRKELVQKIFFVCIKVLAYLSLTFAILILLIRRINIRRKRKRSKN